ncbi:MAG: hypothetical protein RL557_228 [archaeon]|jgi:UTP:GlnB (protein PII) uridylyltransferase
MIAIGMLTVEQLRTNHLERELSEFYALRNCIEYFPPWHFHETVFDHILSVLDALDKIVQRNNKELDCYLAEKPFGHYSRGELLWLMAVFHDIAKPETIIIDKQSYTSCPGHEKQGAIKMRPILNRFDLQPEEREHVLKMIELHGIFCYTQHREDPDEAFAILKKQFPVLYLDLLIFELADTRALLVAESGKKLQDDMIDFYEHKIVEYLNN